MDQQSVRDFISSSHVRTAAFAVLGALTLFLLVSTLSEFKSMRYIGSGVTATNTISVSGEGTVFAVPDVATFSVSVIERASTVTAAQTTATEKANEIIEYLKEAGIEDKDVQTTDYNVNPEYDYSDSSCGVGYCPPSSPVLVGYQVSQTLTVKVRETTKAGSILSGVGTLGASNVSGLSFTVADEDLINAQAREKAIRDAKEKADVLTESLGVEIVRIVGFSENGNYPYYGKTMMESYGRGGAADSAQSAPAPQFPVGQNKIISNVTVVYEIR